MLAEFDCGNFSNHRLQVTENEIIITGLKTPINSIHDVKLFPIVQGMRGLGGCIKFITEDNPNLPVRNERCGWEMEYKGEMLRYIDLARGNCFMYGGDYSDNGWIEQNKKAEEIVALVKGMISQNEATPSVSKTDSPKESSDSGKPEPTKKSFWSKLRGR